jgi:hypothetical protein
VNGTCDLCSTTVTGCAVCTVSDNKLTCSTCLNGYYLNEGACTLCSSANPNYQQCTYNTSSKTVTVTQCTTVVPSYLSATNYLLVTSGGKTSCVANTNNCLTAANSSGDCKTCYNYNGAGYVLVGTKCMPCPAACTSCSASSTAVTCSACMAGYYVSSDKTSCEACGTGCKACTSATACTTCNSGYYMDKGTCTACTPNYCSACTATANSCSSCLPQFYLHTASDKTQTCLLCPPGCATCTNGESCNTCLTGYYKKGNGCSPGTNYCATFNSDGTCKVCMYGARL